jgi:hypothetical protein
MRVAEVVVHQLKVRRLVLVVLVEAVLVAIQMELLEQQTLVAVVVVEKILLMLLAAQAEAV